MLLRVNNIHEKIRDGLPWLSISKLRASSAKTVYSNRAFGQNNRVDQNNNMQWYLHIVKAQKNSKSGWTVQGIVQSVSEFRCLSCFSAAVAKENLFKTLAILLRHPRLAFEWLSVSFVDYWPIWMSDLLLSLHWINPLLHWINSLLHWITWKLLLS